MVFGGIIINAADEPHFEATMQKFRVETGMTGELKWAKVSNGKRDEYSLLMDYFFALLNQDCVHYHSLIIDTHRVDHRRFNGGDHELGFYKFYFQLMLKFGRKYCANGQPISLHVRLDERCSKQSLTDIKRMLNHALRRKTGHDTRPYKSVEPRNSKTCDMIQIVDIITGAIGYCKNGFHLLPGSNQAKCYLVDYIAQHAGVAELGRDTPQRINKFSIWNMRLR